MSVITIQCKLVAPEATRRYLWQLMAEKYTPLINELLKRIAQDAKFDDWRQKGKIPEGVVKETCQRLKQDAQFAEQPGRFYISAIATVHRIFKSWLALQTRLRNQIDGQTRWLAILQSDEELTTASQCDIHILRTKANELLKELAENSKAPASEPNLKKTYSKNKREKKPQQQNKRISKSLFNLYWEIEEALPQCAIAYLLKNGCKVPEKDEDPKKFAQRRRKAEIRLERLINTLQRTRIPKGRDLSWQTWLETLDKAENCVPLDDNQAADWQANLLTEPRVLPFPVNYETNEDLRWFVRSVKLETKEDLKQFIKRLNKFKPNFWLRGALLLKMTRKSKSRLIKIMILSEILDAKARLCVSFNGLGEYSFEIYCAQRQLHWFQRFLEDQEIKRLGEEQRSTSLFTLRSGRISWQQGNKKGDPWNVHSLLLSCAVETDAWTQEGTQEIRQRKADECIQSITRNKAKKDESKNIINRKKTLDLLNNSFPRPSHPPYRGQLSILAGVSFGLDKPATLAIVDIQTGKAITYRSIRQILGKNYKLLNRYRLQHHRHAHKRHKNQRKGASNQLKEFNLGKHIDNLIAHEIVEIAKKYQVSSLVLPDLTNIREVIQSEVQMRAEQKIPGSKECQQQYALQYRASVHRWSYDRLSQSIQSQAAQIGISIEVVKQPLTGTPQEKAKNLAIAAYQSRSQTTCNQFKSTL